MELLLEFRRLSCETSAAGVIDIEDVPAYVSSPFWLFRPGEFGREFDEAPDTDEPMEKSWRCPEPVGVSRVAMKANSLGQSCVCELVRALGESQNAADFKGPRIKGSNSTDTIARSCAQLQLIPKITMPLSHSAVLRYFTLIPTCITVGYGYTYFFRPEAAQTIFEFDHVPTGRDAYIFKTLMGLLGAKVSFIVFALVASTFFASPRFLGSLLLAVAGMAYLDGVVVKTYVGHGEWNHWGYATALVVQGLLLSGLFDNRRPLTKVRFPYCKSAPRA